MEDSPAVESFAIALSIAAFLLPVLLSLFGVGHRSSWRKFAGLSLLLFLAGGVSDITIAAAGFWGLFGCMIASFLRPWREGVSS